MTSACGGSVIPARSRCGTNALASASRAAGSSTSRFIHVWFSHSSFVRSKMAGRGADLAEVEELGQLVLGEDLLVAVGPAEAREVVHHRLGQEALVAVRQHGRRAVALREAFPVRAEDHRDVGEHRQRVAEGLVAEDLLRRVREVVIAADHVGDLHRHVVDDHAEVVRRRPVGPDEDPVVQRGPIEGHVAVHEVGDDGRPGIGDPQPERGGDTGPQREIPATAVVAEGLPARLGRLAPGVELLRRAVAPVGAALGQETLGVGPVDVEAAGLAEIPAVRRRRPPGPPGPSRGRARSSRRGSGGSPRRSSGRDRCPRSGAGTHPGDGGRRAS